MRKANCHPDVAYMARGMCRTCYERTRYRRTKHNFNDEDFAVLWDKQLGLCAICLTAMVYNGRKSNSATVDHDHNTGKVRGLLCRRCNVALGQLDDNIESLKRAINYLGGSLG